MRFHPLALVLCGLSLVASAKDAPEAKTAKAKVKVPSFTMPSLGEVPRAEGLTQKKAPTMSGATRTAAKSPSYEVLEIAHAAGFTAGPNGPQPLGTYMKAVDLKGKPLSTERFSTLVTIRSEQKQGAPIDVAVLDTRGDTVLSATGEFSFVDQQGDPAKGYTTRYQIDWEPSPVRGPGAYKVLVRIGGRPMGTWPLVVQMDPVR